MTEAERRKEYARKWRPEMSGPCCLACEGEFKRGDDVYPVGQTCIHVRCRLLYMNQCKELGIDP